MPNGFFGKYMGRFLPPACKYFICMVMVMPMPVPMAAACTVWPMFMGMFLMVAMLPMPMAVFPMVAVLPVPMAVLLMVAVPVMPMAVLMLLQHFFFQCLLLPNHFINLFPVHLIPWGRNHSRPGIFLPDGIYHGFRLLRLHILGTAQHNHCGIFNLVIEKFTESLHLLGGFRRINHGNPPVQLYFIFLLHFLHGFHHVRKLPYAGRLNQNPVRMEPLHDFPEVFPKIPYQGTANAAGIQFADFNAGIL